MGAKQSVGPFQDVGCPHSLHRSAGKMAFSGSFDGAPLNNSLDLHMHRRPRQAPVGNATGEKKQQS